MNLFEVNVETNSKFTDTIHVHDTAIKLLLQFKMIMYECMLGKNNFKMIKYTVKHSRNCLINTCIYIYNFAFFKQTCFSYKLVMHILFTYLLLPQIIVVE